MKIIHCADLHLDSRMETGLSKEKAKERRLELLRTFTQMIERGAAEGVDAVLLCGDLFDARTISARARNCVLDAVREHPKMRFYYLQGNHDQNSFLSDLAEKPENLKTFGPDWTSYEEQDGVTITGAEITEGTADALAERLILDAERINIVMLHGQVTEYGAKRQQEGFSLRKLKNRNIDYLALGHIHSYRRERLDERGLWCYSGCLEGRGFDECGEKGYVLLEVKDGRLSSEFVPFACRRFQEVCVDVSGLFTQEEIRRAIRQALREIPPTDAVKIILTGETPPEAEKDAAAIEKWLENDYYLLKVKDETRLAIHPEDYQYDVSLKGEFVRLVLASRLSAAEKEQVLRLGIRALTGED
ncbi:MAG: metallophosphoesterase [Lachnospiraceae bacterium]|nr:metallophosphoesterase [Lachnospiraceae bacterium]